MREFTCDECGSLSLETPGGSASRFCSAACRYKWKNRNRDQRKSVTYGVCPCGRPFGGPHNSKWCKAHRGVMKQPETRPTLADWPEFGPTLEDWPEFGPTVDPVVVRGDCLRCGKSFHGTRARRFCGDDCRLAWHHVFTDGACSPIKYVRCAECPAIAIRREGQAGRFCSRKCAKKVERRKRRAALRGVKHEPYSSREIADRDNWTCHLCNMRVPDQQWAARPDDPTIDHLIPVSAGGDDIRSNVALAHNRCNYMRGTRGLAQLRLTG